MTGKEAAVEILDRLGEHQRRREKLVHHIGLRLDDPMMGRIEQIAARVETNAGVRISRHDVLRALLEVALDELETRSRA